MYTFLPGISLEMHLNGEIVDTVSASSYLLKIEYNKHLNDLKTELINKNRQYLSRSEDLPVFFLNGIPSSINSFVSLGQAKIM